MQIAWPGSVTLVDTLKVDIGPLRKVLESPAVAVMHAAEQDLEILQTACGVLPRHLFDTQLAAAFVGYSSAGLGALLSRELGVTLPKGDRLTNWTRRPLTKDQTAYAAADVAHLLELRDRLLAQLAADGRVEWAADEALGLLSRVQQRADLDVIAETAWWRLKEARRLKGESPRRGPGPRRVARAPGDLARRADQVRAVRHGRHLVGVPAAA